MPLSRERPVIRFFLFDTLSWLLFVAAFTGILGGAITQRIDPYIENDRVWRHDFAAKFSHWTHAGGCVLLLISGVGLGFFFLPRLLPDAARLMDLHFLGALFFVFGGFFWATNTILSPYRFKEHMLIAALLSRELPTMPISSN